MALDYKSVLDIYDASREGGLTDKSLPDWSQEMNTKTGTELYSAGLHDNFIKRGSAGLDKLIEATGIPAYGKALGGDVGEVVGDRAAGEKVGEGLGRMSVNFAPLLIPGVGWGATAARLGGTALLSGAETYTETGSPAAGLLSAGTAAALPKVADVAEQYALGKLGARLATKEVTGEADRYIGETLGQKVGSAAAGQVAAAGLFGASGAAQEVAAGEPVSSPLTTENLLSLTLGQLPFAAAHLGGRAIHEQFGGKSAAMRADEIKKVLDLSEATLKLRETKKEMEDRPPVKDMPDVAKPEAEAFTPEQYELARKNRLIISQVRGEMLAVKDNAGLTDEQKVEQTNDLLNQEYAALKESEAALVTKDTIFGNKIQDETPRQNIIGTQLAINKDGTWRAVHVADDPFNPEELRGKVISYSTAYEPNPQFGLQSEPSHRYGGTARYSLPDPQWWTMKSKEEWDAGGRQGKKVVDPNLQPDLPTLEEPMSDEEVSAHLHDLNNVHSAIDAAATTGDLQKAVTDLNAVRLQNNMTPVNDDTLRYFIDRVTKAGVAPDKAVKDATKAVVAKTKRTITTKQQSTLINAGFDQASIDAMTPEQQKDALAATRESLKKKPKLAEGIEPTEEAVADEEAMSERERQRSEATKPTDEEAATVAAKFGEDNDVMRGMSIVTADKVSQGKTDDIATQPVAEVVNDAAVAAINDPKVMEVFNMLPDKGERNIHKDAADFVDLVEEFGSLTDLDPQEAADYLNSKLEVTSVEAGDIKDFLSQPHVKVMSDALDRNLTDSRRAFEAPTPIAPTEIQEHSEKFTDARGEEHTTQILTDPQTGARLRYYTFNDPTTGQLLSLNISRADTPELAQRQGGATKLIQELQRKADELGIPIRSGFPNEKSKPLLEKLGFRPAFDPYSVPLAERNTPEFREKTSRESPGEFIYDPGSRTTEAPAEKPNLVEPTDANKLALEKEVLALPKDQQDAFFSLQRQAVDVLEQTQKAGRQVGVPLEQIDREALAKSDKLTDLWNKQGATLADEQAKYQQIISGDVGVEAPTEGTTPQTTAPRHDAPPWVPEAPRDVQAIADMGLNGNGKDMLNFVTQSDNPLLSSLGLDLAKFGPSLERISGGVYDIGNGAFIKPSPSGFEIRFSPGLLRTEPDAARYMMAHELVHGLTLAELHNPTKAGYVESFNSMRGRLIGALPEGMKRAINDAINSDWYSKWGRREVTLESLYPTGTQAERSILYSLLNNDELVTGGLTSPAMQRYMRSIKSEGKPWYSKFAELIKTVLQMKLRVKDTIWEEFLSHTHGLMDRGSHIADFKNYANRYFENLGMGDNFVRTNTQRAMGLILSNLREGHTVEDVLQRVRLGSGNVRSPEYMKAVGDTNAMFAEKGDDAAVTQMTLTEAGHMPDAMGLQDFADSVMSGKLDPEFIDMLPEPAARMVFETAKDTANIVGVVRGATLDQNRGVLNVADPELLHNLSKETLKSVDKVLAQNKLHDMAVKDIQGLFAMPPDGFQDKMVNAPDEIPPEFMGESKKSMFDHVENFLSPATQIARSIPESAEAFSRGRQLHSNQRKMATEAQKPFGMDLETMELSSENVKNTAKTFEQPKLTNAVNKWIHQNQVVGDRTGEVRVLDADDPRVQDILRGLTPKDKDIVEDMVNKQSMSTQFVQSEILEKRLQIGTTDGAVIAQGAEGGKLRDAVAKSEQLIRAFVADRNDPVAARTADAQIAEVQQKMSLEGFNKLATFAQIVAEGWKTQQEIFQKNPAWASGQRHGKFLMEFTKNGKAQLKGVESRKEAEVIAEGRSFKLTPNRQEDADRPPFMGFGSSDTIARLRDLDQKYIDHMQSSGAFTPDDIELMKRYSPIEQFTTEQVYRGGVRGVTPQPRRLTKGAEDLPWLENHFTFINKTANYWSRQLFRSQARAHLLDPEIKSNPDLHNKLESYYENLLVPDTQLGHFLQRSATSWFMGYNPASALVNATQPFMTHVSEFTRLTGKPFNSYKRVLGGLAEVMAHAKTKKWANEDHEWLIHKATQDGFVDNTMYDDNAAAQETVATRFKQILSRQRPQTTGQRLGTLAGNFSNVGMWMFRTVERMNNMSALLSSFDLYKELQPNLSRDALYEKAVSFNEAVNYGGGPAARPIGLYKAFPRTAAMMATSMQSYNLGSMFQLARYLKDGFFRPAGLTPHEVYSARIAGVQMLATQLGAAGVLGLPLASGMLAILNAAFPGIELNRHFREGMNTLMGGDERNGNILTDIAMTGVPSMMGWDLQSRLSMGNTIPGVSEVNGFQPEQLAGAPINLISNFVKGGIKLASGDPHGAEAFVPNALKKFEQLLRSGGQVLDYRDRPVFTPTIGEKVGIALGFNPKRLSDFNAASRMAKQTDDNIKRREGQFHQSMAEEVLKGNFGSVRQALQQKIREDKTYDPVNAVRSIAGSAEELTFPRDLRREGPRSAADPRSKLLSTFNLPASAPSETDRLLFRRQVEQRLGIPTTSSTDLQTATVMDRLRQQQPLAPRAELRRQATLLLRGSRPQTLQAPTE